MSVEIDAILPKGYNAEISVVAPQGGGTGGGVPRDEFNLLEEKVDGEIERAKKAEEELGKRIDDIDIPEVDLSGYVKNDDLATVATSGSYDDLENKPEIPNEVTEKTVSGWGFTKNTGTYTMPASGIPASDLSQEVQDALSNAEGCITSTETIEEVENIEENLVANALRKTPQVLTNTEKEIARGNIGAVSYSDLSSAISNAIVNVLNTEV